MFKSPTSAYPDFSSDLRDKPDWKIAALRSFEYAVQVSAVAVEPITGLLAIGTASGALHLFGGPSVEVKLVLPEPAPVRFVQFSCSTSQIVTLDANSVLNVWDLSVFGRPKHVALARFDGATSLTVSPSHSHALIGLESGEIRTYDLPCLRKSDYRMPNMWKLYEEKTMATRMDGNAAGSGVVVDVVSHPRDLNLLFVAYSGGVILSDLTQRNTLRAYEFELPAGAPGGYGFGHLEIMTHRRPSVTAIALHPAGHFFAVGYSDGTVAFWAIEDEDQPLLARTLDDLDVNKVNYETLEQKHEPTPEREPIYKLTWSSFANSTDPRGGESALTILGGLLMAPGEPTGLTVEWLPPFNPGEPPTPAPNNTPLHPSMRAAMQTSLIPKSDYFYDTAARVAQDFFLVPRNNPHFGGQHDPIAIIISLEDSDSRVLETYEFPPPVFTAAAELPAAQEEEAASGSVADDLAEMLKSMTVNDDPRALSLPTQLSMASTGLVRAELVSLDRQAYEDFVAGQGSDPSALQLRGGTAWNDESKAKEIKLAKFQPPRILLTIHRNLSAAVQFLDMSAQLLVTTDAPIHHHFPKPLPGLTIDLKTIITDASVVERTTHEFIEHAQVQSAYIAPHSLECVIQFFSGHLVIYRLKTGASHPAAAEPVDEEIALLDHVLSSDASRYAPYFLLTANKPVTAYSLSDIGFLAVAYGESLIVVDMRGPRILLRRGREKSKDRMSFLHAHAAEANNITALHWSVAALEDDQRSSVRLIVGYASGAVDVFTVVNGADTDWRVEGDIKKVEGVREPLNGSAFVLDARKGCVIRAARDQLARSMQGPSTADDTILVIAGTKGARCIANITGPRICKVDWATRPGASVRCVRVMEKMGSQALVAFTDSEEVLMYSLPSLDHIATFNVPARQTMFVSCDDTGDWIAYTPSRSTGRIEQLCYGTLFDFRRAYLPPDLDFWSSQLPSIPAQPQPVSLGPASILSSWFRFGQSMTGDQLDKLLGGPNRPIPEKVVPKPQSPETAAEVAKTVEGTQSTLYSRLQAAMGERGQLLSDLEERFNQLEEGSRSMAAQAKRMAAQQTAKSWLGF
ncbi:WD40 containing SNARE-dependent exocytosis protein [Mycena kentingensis (nom. inval.)]|nr:WD40 containing SNARE-dependent exocytosis protein [Mycena kentingensis (nom. inval.)]